MTRRLPRFDSHVQAFRDCEAAKAAALQAATDRAANLPFFFSLTPADSYATLWDSEHEAARPVGTLTRPRVFGGNGLWTVTALDGSEVYSSPFRPSAMQATRSLLRHAAKVEEAAKAAAMEAEEAATQARRANQELAAAASVTRVESGAVGPDWADMPKGQAFYAQAFHGEKAGAFAFGLTEGEARATLAAALAPAVEDSAAFLQSSGPACYRDAAAAYDRAARVYALADMPKGAARCALAAENLAYSFPAEEAARPLEELLQEEAGAKAAAHICRPLVADLAQESGPLPRDLTPEEQAKAAAWEEAAESAEARKDWRATALAWAEGAKLCRIAGQNDSAALWEGHCRRAAGEAFKAAAKARRAVTPKPAPRLTLAGFPARFA